MRRLRGDMDVNASPNRVWVPVQTAERGPDGESPDCPHGIHDFPCSLSTVSDTLIHYAGDLAFNVCTDLSESIVRDCQTPAFAMHLDVVGERRSLAAVIRIMRDIVPKWICNQSGCVADRDYSILRFAPQARSKIHRASNPASHH